MSLKSKFKSFFALEDEFEDEDELDQFSDEDFEMSRNVKNSSKQNIVSLQSVKNTSSKMVLLEPRVYAEAQEIADHLKNKKAVVVNLQRISHDQAKRIIDFLSGTVYAIGGDIQKIGVNIVLCTPENVDVSGNISELAIEEDTTGKRW